MQYPLLFIILVALGAAALPYLLHAFLSNSLNRKIAKKEYDQATHLIEHPLYKIMFGSFQQQIDLLKIEILKGNPKQILQFTKELLTHPLSNKQKTKICHLSYHYFIDREMKDYAYSVLTQIKMCAGAGEFEYDEMIYNIIFEQKSDYIDLIEGVIPNVKGQQLGYLQFLLGLQYNYINDKVNSTTYLKRARKNLKGTSYYKKVKKSLEN